MGYRLAPSLPGASCKALRLLKESPDLGALPMGGKMLELMFGLTCVSALLFAAHPDRLRQPYTGRPVAPASCAPLTCQARPSV